MIGQRRAGSNPGGKLRTARPVGGRGFPPCAAMSWKYFETGNWISTKGPGLASLPAMVAAMAVEVKRSRRAEKKRPNADEPVHHPSQSDSAPARNSLFQGASGIGRMGPICPMRLAALLIRDRLCKDASTPRRYFEYKIGKNGTEREKRDRAPGAPAKQWHGGYDRSFGST